MGRRRCPLNTGTAQPGSCSPPGTAVRAAPEAAATSPAHHCYHSPTGWKDGVGIRVPYLQIRTDTWAEVRPRLSAQSCCALGQVGV